MKKIFFISMVLIGLSLTSCGKEDTAPIQQPQKVEEEKVVTPPSTPPTEEPKEPKTKIVYEAISILGHRNFYLNSEYHVGSNTRTREWFPITLPQNTVRFLFSVSTAEGKNPLNNINLIGQTASILSGGITSTLLGTIAGKVIIPQLGNRTPGRVNVILFDRENGQKFISGSDDYKYYPVGSNDNFISGTIDIHQIGTLTIEDNYDFFKNFFYVGFQNPRSLTGVNISFEAIAIVKKEITTYDD